MSNIYTSADQLIGKTPLLELTHIEKARKPLEINRNRRNRESCWHPLVKNGTVFAIYCECARKLINQ